VTVSSSVLGKRPDLSITASGCERAPSRRERRTRSAVLYGQRVVRPSSCRSPRSAPAWHTGPASAQPGRGVTWMIAKVRNDTPP